MVAMDHTNEFNLVALETAERKYLIPYTSHSWLQTAVFWIRTNTIDISEKPKTILIVCDKSYDNVPQPTIWNLYKKTPAHAVGFADGSADLITPAQFAALDLSEFVRATNFFGVPEN